jgi:hypothetical protein
VRRGQRAPERLAPASNECSIHLELGRERTFNRQINRLGRKPGFLEGDKLEAAVTNGRWVLTHLPAAPRKPEPLRHYFPTEEVTPQQRPATSLRCAVTQPLCRHM